MHFAEVAYFTDKVAAMTDFYRRLLATEPVAQSAGMAIFMVGETKLFIHERYAPGAGDLPPVNHVALAVEDVDATCAQLTQVGLTLEVTARDYYWGRSAYFRDPDGQLIEITQTAVG